jgi:hypothetical protein
MLKNNHYKIDREFDYATVKGIVLKSLEKIAKKEALKKGDNVVFLIMAVLMIILTTLARPRRLHLH